MKWKTSLVTLGLTSLLAGCVTNSERVQLNSYKPDQLFEDNIAVGGQNVPLPKGKWRLVASEIDTNSNHITYGTVQLIQVHDNTVTDDIIIHSTIGTGPQHGFSSSRFCDRVDLVYKDMVENGAGRHQDCLALSHARLVRSSKKGNIFNERMDYVRTHRLESTNIAPFSFHRFTRFGKLLEVRHFTNPEHYADISRVPYTNWAESEWHVDHYYRHPSKLDYIESLKAQAKQYHSSIRASLDN